MPRPAMTMEQINEVRGRILREAAMIVFDEGIGALSMRYLASKLGMTAGALYKYFPSRQDLLLAHFSMGMNDLHSRLTANGASQDPLMALREYAVIYADFALSDPVRYRLMFLEDNKATENAGVKVKKVAETYNEFIRRMAAAIDARLLGAGDAKLKTDILWAGLHGAVSVAITAIEMDLGDPKAFVERMIDTILLGLSREDKQERP